MVAWRYEISLLMFKNISLPREIFFNTRSGEILYLRAAMCMILILYLFYGEIINPTLNFVNGRVGSSVVMIFK